MDIENHNHTSISFNRRYAESLCPQGARHLSGGGPGPAGGVGGRPQHPRAGRAAEEGQTGVRPQGEHQGARERGDQGEAKCQGHKETGEGVGNLAVSPILYY